MQWRRLFNLEVPDVNRRLRAGAQREGAKGVFFTQQTLITFPVATFVVGMIWKVIGALVPQLKDSLWVPLILALLMGFFIFIVGVTDPDSQLTNREKYIAGAVAFVNSLYIFASAAGIVTAIESGGG